MSVLLLIPAFNVVASDVVTDKKWCYYAAAALVTTTLYLTLIFVLSIKWILINNKIKLAHDSWIY